MGLRRCVSVVAMGVLGLAFVAVRSGVAAEDAVSDEARGKAWWAHVQYLADDSMKGRLTGSEEYVKAAAYVVEKFKSYGLQPAGVNGGFYQPVKFDVQRVLADKSSVGLVVDGKAEPLVLGTDVVLGARSAQVGKNAVSLGLWLWFGFSAMMWIGAIMWERTPWQVAVIHSGDWLIKTVLIIAILGMSRKFNMTSR